MGSKEEGHSPIQAETLPRHNRPLPLLTHPSNSRLPYSSYTLSGTCCPLSSQCLSPGARLSEYLGTGEGQAGSLNSCSMEQNKLRDPHLSPTAHHQPSAHRDLCCSQQRFLWYLRRCEIHSGSSQPCCLCFLLSVPPVFPQLEMDIALTREGSPQQKDAQGCPSYPLAIWAPCALVSWTQPLG